MIAPQCSSDATRHGVPSSWHRVAACTIVAILLSSPAAAQGPPSPRFGVDRWTSEDGLPGEAIRDLIQSEDGYVWMLASGSVVRFDGNRFVSYRGAGLPGAELLNGTASTLAAGGGDTVFVAVVVPEGVDYVRIVRGRVEAIGSVEAPFSHIMRDGDGGLWIGATNLGVWRLEGGEIRDSIDIGIFSFGNGISAELGPQWMTDRVGRLWLNARHRDSIAVVEDGVARFVAPSGYPALVTRPSTRDVLFPSILRDSVVIRDALGGPLVAFPRRAGLLPRLVDRHGRLWVSTPAGLEAYAAGSLDPVATITLPGQAPVTVSALVEDREGNIWVRTPTSGVYRIQEQPASVVGKAGGLRTVQTLSVARGRSGSVLGIDGERTAYRIVDGQAQIVLDPYLMPDGTGVFGMAEDGHGTLWLTLQRYSARQLTTFLLQRRDGLADHVIPIHSPVFAIAEDPRPGGPLWLSGHITHRIDRSASPMVIDTFHIATESPRDIAIDRTGTAWIPADDALVRISGDSVEKFRGAPYPDRSARSVLADEDGTIWIGTYGQGLLRFRDGEFRAVTEAEGLSENVVSSMLDDGAGSIWMAGNRSIHRVSRTHLTAFFDGTASRVEGVAYTRADGIPNPETSGYRSARDDAGRMWFATFGGLVVIDPARAIELEGTPPLAYVEEVVLANGDIRFADTDESGADLLHLSAEERRFDVRYTAISLRDPATVGFRYKLDGFDDGWREAGNVRTATYTNVGPGRYTFRLQAVSGGGVASDEATLAVVVAPFIHETPWFIALLTLTMIAGVGLVVRSREQRLVRRQVLLNGLVDERTAALREEKRRSEDALKIVAGQAERLRSLDRARSRFFENVSHEFRTPLTLMVGPLRDVQEGRLGELPEAAREEIEVVLKNGHRLNELVDQLLDIARLESGELVLNPHTADIVGFVGRIARSFEPLARTRSATFEVDLPEPPVPMVFDEDRLEKAFNNLLGNAFKFTEEGGWIRLTGLVEETEQGGAFVVRIEDDGVGIPDLLLNRVFDRFYQVDDGPNRRHPGAGLGLAFTKDLVSLHGGTIEVASAVGGGSTFTVRLPLGAASPLEPRDDDNPANDRGSVRVAGPSAPALSGAPRPEPDGDHDATTVLLVEDNDGVRAYVRRHLAEHYRVLEASDGRTGLEEARRVTPDLIITDLMMPDMDGQTMVEEIRDDPHIDFVPVIMLTAKASHDSLMTGLRGGADDYLTKPFDIEELVLRAHNIIEGRRRIRERFHAEDRALPALSFPRSTREDADAEFTMRINAVLSEHIGDDAFGVEQFARALHMSRSSLYRKTEQVLGQSPMSVILDFRLDQAAQWLRETDGKVNEIAYGVGFKSVPHFSRKFRERFDTTPTLYRQG
ncbi:MAG: response regulator [Longimicrobiales bacterium]